MYGHKKDIYDSFFEKSWKKNQDLAIFGPNWPKFAQIHYLMNGWSYEDGRPLKMTANIMFL